MFLLGDDDAGDTPHGPVCAAAFIHHIDHAVLETGPSPQTSYGAKGVGSYTAPDHSLTTPSVQGGLLSFTAVANPEHIQLLFQSSNTQGKSACGQPQLNLTLGTGIFSVVTDFYVLTIPVSLVWGLWLPLPRCF